MTWNRQPLQNEQVLWRNVAKPGANEVNKHWTDQRKQMIRQSGHIGFMVATHPCVKSKLAS